VVFCRFLPLHTLHASDETWVETFQDGLYYIASYQLALELLKWYIYIYIYIVIFRIVFYCVLLCFRIIPKENNVARLCNIIQTCHVTFPCKVSNIHCSGALFSPRFQHFLVVVATDTLFFFCFPFFPSVYSLIEHLHIIKLMLCFSCFCYKILWLLPF
jgi:hypothetical protein